MALFNHPSDVAVAPDGAVYIADCKNHRIRLIRNKQVSTLAGSGIDGFADGPVDQAQFSFPTSLAVAQDGTVYVADTSNHLIRMIRKGQVSTFAGNGIPGFANGPIDQAQFWLPRDVAVAEDGTVYVADSANNCIRKIRDGQVSTLAGDREPGFLDGAAGARFSDPYGVCVSSDGSVYVADGGNNRIRKIRHGQVSTVAGNRRVRDGEAAEAQFNFPKRVIMDSNAVLYVSETRNQRVRMIRDRQVSTLAGNGERGFTDGAAADARFAQPDGIAVDRSGAIYVADSWNNRIRMIHKGCVFTVAGNGERGFADGPTLINLPVDTVPSVGQYMEKSMGIATDVSIAINDKISALELQRSFVSLRCPALLKSSLRVQSVDQQSIALFGKYLYTEQITEDLSLTQLMGLSCLMMAADMKPVAYSLLDRLQKYPATAAQDQTLDVEELVRLYCYSLDLSPFEEGRKVAVYLLQKQSAMLRPHVKKLPELLGKHSGYLLDLMQELLVPLDSLQPPISPQIRAGPKGTCLSVAETLEKLHTARARSGDFAIKIKGEKKAEEVHSYVMYAMWPYFRHMYDAGMREAQDRQLELPAVGDDGGMSVELLRLIIEVCYKPNILQTHNAASERVSATVATQTISVASLYLLSQEGDSRTPLDRLVDFAQEQVISGLTVDVCIEVYKQTSHYGCKNAANAARAMILENIETLTADPVRRQELRSLSKDLLIDLLQAGGSS